MVMPIVKWFMARFAQFDDYMFVISPDNKGVRAEAGGPGEDRNTRGPQLILFHLFMFSRYPLQFKTLFLSLIGTFEKFLKFKMQSVIGENL